MSARRLPAGRVRLALLLRLIGLREFDTLRLLHWLSNKFPIRSMPDRNLAGQFFLTNRVRSDGGGSQVLYAFFTLAIADWLKMPYRHRPFERIEHYTGGEQDFIDKWNNVFDFSKHFGTPESFPVFSLGSRFQTLRALTSRSREVGITSHKFRDVSDRHPEILEEKRGILREIYSPREATESVSSIPRGVLFHLRRGDVTSQSHPLRFTAVETLAEDSEILSTALGLQLAERTVVGDLEPLEAELLAEKGFHVASTDDAFGALHQLASAQVLVTGVSSFSYLAGLISQGTVVFRNFWHPPMADWVSLSALHAVRDF